jgi:hypothetical protein
MRAFTGTVAVADWRCGIVSLLTRGGEGALASCVRLVISPRKRHLNMPRQPKKIACLFCPACRRRTAWTHQLADYQMVWGENWHAASIPKRVVVDGTGHRIRSAIKHHNVACAYY